MCFFKTGLFLDPSLLSYYHNYYSSYNKSLYLLEILPLVFHLFLLLLFIFLKLHSEMIIHASLLPLVWLFKIRWITAHQAPLSSEFSRQEYWSGLPFPSPGDLPDAWIKPASHVSSALQADSLLPEPSGNDNLSNHNFPERWTQC